MIPENPEGQSHLNSVGEMSTQNPPLAQGLRSHRFGSPQSWMLTLSVALPIRSRGTSLMSSCSNGKEEKGYMVKERKTKQQEGGGIEGRGKRVKGEETSGKKG